MRKEIVSTIVITIIAIGQIYIIYSGAVELANQVITAAIWTADGIILGLFLWGWGDHILRWLKIIGGPALTLTPLKHYKGYFIPPNEPMPPRKDETAELEKVLVRVTKENFTTSEVEQLSGSQILQICPTRIKIKISDPRAEEIRVVEGSIENQELLIKFGVIRVCCIKEEALNCKVQMRVHLVEELGEAIVTDWRYVGYVNWYSAAKKEELVVNYFKSLKAAISSGLKTYLLNTSEDIHNNEEKDLLLFYMKKDNPTVTACTDLESPVGNARDNHPLKFEVELSVTAQKYPRTTFKYLVTAKWDDYQIQQI